MELSYQGYTTQPSSFLQAALSSIAGGQPMGLRIRNGSNSSRAQQPVLLAQTAGHNPVLSSQ